MGEIINRSNPVLLLGKTPMKGDDKKNYNYWLYPAVNNQSPFLR